MPDCRMGAVIMKMMRRTRTTSMKGTMLMSERLVWVDLESWGIGGYSGIVPEETDIRYRRSGGRKRVLPQRPQRRRRGSGEEEPKSTGRSACATDKAPRAVMATPGFLVADF